MEGRLGLVDGASISSWLRMKSSSSAVRLANAASPSAPASDVDRNGLRLLVGIQLGHVADHHWNRRRADGARQQFIRIGLPLIDGNAESQIESDHFGARLARPRG